jgi:hypothetical protein
MENNWKFQPSNIPNTRDCEHGHQRRKCPHCEIIALEKENAMSDKHLSSENEARSCTTCASEIILCNRCHERHNAGNAFECSLILAKRIAFLEELLREIAEHPHCTVGAGELVIPYTRGACNGHRCAAAIARRAFDA